MPELPDVEVMRRTIAHSALHKNIVAVEINDDTIVKGSGLKKLKGSCFEKTMRHGKLCGIKTKQGDVIIHFGMTGEVADDCDVCFRFEKGALGIKSQRKLGRVELGDWKQQTQELGPDALSISKEEFLSVLEQKRGMIKTAMMDQHVLSGIGNIYADEILYQASIRPDRDVTEMTKEEKKRTYQVMKRVLKVAIRNHANPEEMPHRYLLRRREEGKECEGGTIATCTIGGRTTYYCPEKQEKKAKRRQE